ncbi:MAG: cell division protein FtsK, partial [Mucilaginibacter sp.]|nr:cell division protein FtsK [Mucilaginibacter sp.]
MPIKGNQFRSNSFKEENQPREPGAKLKREKPVKETGERLQLFDLRDGRAIKIIGLFFLVLSVFFLIAFTSYLFTWQQDQSYVSKANGGWGNLFKTTKELMENGVNNPVVDNWLGKFGALLSNQFIFEWFGIASFGFVFIFFIIGYRLLFKIKLFSVSKMLAYTLFTMVFLSITIGFFHAFIIDYPHFLEGEFGFWSNRLLSAQVGEPGTGGLLIFAGLTVLIIAYNIDFKLPKLNDRAVEPMSVDGEISPEPVELVEDEPSLPVEWPRNGNRIKDDNLSKAANSVPLTQQPMVQNPMFHEPLVLTPDPFVSNEPEEDNEIPLTIDVTRPNPVMNIEKSDDEKAKSLVEQFGTYDHKLELASYKYPTLDLLENYGSNKISVDSTELEAN